MKLFINYLVLLNSIYFFTVHKEKKLSGIPTITQNFSKFEKLKIFIQNQFLMTIIENNYSVKGQLMENLLDYLRRVNLYLENSIVVEVFR